MGLKYHIASKYKVEWEGGSYRWDEFDHLRQLLVDALESNDMGSSAISVDENDCWVEFDRSELEELLEDDKDLGEEPEALKKFIWQLLHGGDPDLDYIHLELW